MTYSLNEHSPTLTNIIQKNIESVLSQTNTCFPGVIESFDSGKQTAVVRPAFQSRITDIDGEPIDIDLPLLPEVPVFFVRFGESFIYHPVKRGDNCLVLVSQRSISQWKEDSKTSTIPDSQRKFNLNDCLCFIGFSDLNSGLKPTDINSYEMNLMTAYRVLAQGKIVMETKEKFKMKAQNVELKELLNETLDFINDLFSNWTPMPGSNDGGTSLKTAFTTAQSKIFIIKQKVSQFFE